MAFLLSMPISEGKEDCFYTVNGRVVTDLTDISPLAIVHKHYRLRGGKGAIGSQIEKTTNHEMCRDLSGRRMRDVNMEHKLKEWYAKASEREREKFEKYCERRQKRREMLEKGPLPDHKFSDREYERQKRKITYELKGALDEAIKNILNEKRASTSTEPSTSSGQPETKRAKLWIEQLDANYSSSSTSSSSDDDEADGDDLNLPSFIKECLEDDATTSTCPDENEVPSIDVPNSIPEEKPLLSIKVDEKEQEQTECPKTPVEPISDEQLQSLADAHALETLGLDVLKQSLLHRGLKCGGTLSERATRLFSIRGLTPEQYPKKLRVVVKQAN